MLVTLRPALDKDLPKVAHSRLSQSLPKWMFHKDVFYGC